MTQSELEKRLHALRTEDGEWEDWPELLRRGERERASRTRRRTLVAAIAFALFAVPAIALAVRLTDVIVVGAEKEEIPSAEELGLPYVFGDVVRTGRGVTRLSQPLLAPLLGQDAALAVPSPDGRLLAYHAWKGAENGTPLIRMHGLRSGNDPVFEAGAQSLAWRADGALATMQALRPRYENSPEGTLGGHLGHVVVRRSLEAAPRRWTKEATQYTVRAWAGPTLLVNVHPSYVYRGRQPDRGLHALDGPERMRALPLDDLIAVGPDGTLAAGPPLASGDGPPAPFLNVVRVAGGQLVARLALPRDLLTVTGIGSWVGDRIVARGASRTGTGALLVFRFAGGELTLEKTIRLDRETALSAGVKGFRGVSIGQPTFAGPEARYVIFRVNALGEADSYETMFLTCERTGPICRKGRSLEPLTRWAALVYNPSRPLPGSG